MVNKLSRNQLKQLMANGVSVTEFEEGLHQVPWLDYWKPLRDSNREPRLDSFGMQMFEMVRLPADPFSLGHYLKKGFRVTPPDAKDEFTCPSCGKVCANKLGLYGHMRSHGDKLVKKGDKK